MLASYEASFAQTWGRKARDLLEEHGPSLYGMRVRPDARAMDRWYTDQGGDQGGRRDRRRAVHRYGR